MKLESFLLDLWLDEHLPKARFNLAASTGPSWNLEALYQWMSPSERQAMERRGYGAALAREERAEEGQHQRPQQH